MSDQAAVEEMPVWLEVNGRPVVTWMCTPDLLEELAVGWLHGEGYIETVDEVHAPALRHRPRLLGRGAAGARGGRRRGAAPAGARVRLRRRRHLPRRSGTVETRAVARGAAGAGAAPRALQGAVRAGRALQGHRRHPRRRAHRRHGAARPRRGHRAPQRGGQVHRRAPSSRGGR